jgi:hypothetical protein
MCSDIRISAELNFKTKRQNLNLTSPHLLKFYHVLQCKESIGNSKLNLILF